MVRIACKCDTCKINAEKVHVPFPMAVDVTPTLAETLKVTDGYVGKRAHGIVHSAHHPVLGQSICTTTSTLPVVA
jgi:hypothetical protein